MTLPPRYRALFVFVATLPLTGCLFRTRTIERQVSTAPLKTATQSQLIDYINSQAAKIRTVNATVDIDLSATVDIGLPAGGVRKGKVTDYPEIRGYVLVRKPNMLRMIGLLPVVRTQALDMVSDGQSFKLWIPSKNRMIEGRNDVPTPGAKTPLETLRPQYFYDAMLLPEISPNHEIAVMENDIELVAGPKGRQVEQPDYEIDVIRKNPDDGWFLSRKIIFSRTDLLPHRQIVYDQDGNQTTDSQYENYKDNDGVNFPSQIEVRLPQQKYDMVLHMVKLQLNTTLSDQQLRLEDKPGAEIIHLDRPQAGQVRKNREEAKK
jgi:outer membrane lipoprotein-sorting protein